MMTNPTGRLTQGQFSFLPGLNACRKTVPNHYIRLMAFDSTRNTESVMMSFIVNRPQTEPGFQLERQQVNGRSMHYTIRGYAAGAPVGERHAPNQT